MEEKQILGRFLNQENSNFPVDCETLDYLQNNMAIVSVLGNVLGDKAILQGCNKIGDKNYTKGYVFLKTKAFQNGEILFFEGGVVEGKVYVKEEAIDVTVHEDTYSSAYVIRSLAPGVGNEYFEWSSFKKFKTLFELEQVDNQQNLLIDQIIPPLGTIQIWAGRENNLPLNYKLCNGDILNRDNYEELYNVIGKIYSDGLAPGKLFRLPDLRGRFIVGYDPRDSDYNEQGSKGGEKTHILTTNELPSHVHKLRDYYYIEGQEYNPIDGAENVYENYSGSHDTDNDNCYLHFKNHSTEATGVNKAHENRPPYYTLAYIMRVK